MKLTFKILLPMALLGILFTSCGNRQKKAVAESVNDQYYGWPAVQL